MNNKFTPTTRKIILKSLEQGTSKRCAAAVAGITAGTLYHWIKKGKEEQKGIYKDFKKAVEIAEEAAEAMHLQTITDAAKKGSWQASAWFLERTKPERYGRWAPKQKEVEPIKLSQKEKEAILKNDQALTAEDIALTWKRQLILLEKSYAAGQIPHDVYFRNQHALTSTASKMLELQLRGGSESLPLVKVVLDASSPHIAKPRDEPVTITKTEKCGDLIEIS